MGLSRAIVSAAIRDSFAMLAPRVQFRNPVMLGVYVGSKLIDVCLTALRLV